MGKELVVPNQLYSQILAGWNDARLEPKPYSYSQSMEQIIVETARKTIEGLTGEIDVLLAMGKQGPELYVGVFRTPTEFLGVYMTDGQNARYFGRHPFAFRLGIVDARTNPNDYGYVALPNPPYLKETKEQQKISFFQKLRSFITLK